MFSSNDRDPNSSACMKNKRKIFNDPVYGFVTIPYEIIFDLIEHPIFQRLRHVSQLGLTHLIYPGALHTRFHHAIGALHLMTLAIESLRSKGVEIEDEEAEAVSIAILLHDLGHGPFSHALEERLIGVNHEVLSIHLMRKLNDEFEGALTLAIDIFQDKYPKRFLHQLISSQLDMDRMDYLNRDSFYTGVMEGKIGYDRIIKMLQVIDDQLVVEEKGIYSVEKFLVARKIMYWQVYLHKTVLAAELMLIAVIERVRELDYPSHDFLSDSLYTLLHHSWNDFDMRSQLTDAFLTIDDHDVFILLKNLLNSSDYILQTLATGLVQRQLFSVEMGNFPFPSSYVEQVISNIAQVSQLKHDQVTGMCWTGSVSNDTYVDREDEIQILVKGGRTVPLSELSGYKSVSETTVKYYFCHPKI